MSLVATGLAGVLFGFALAAPPGPMNAIIAEESVLRGWRAGVRAGLGAMSADIAFLVLALLGMAAVVERTEYARTVLLAAGGLVMLYFAYGALESTRDAFTPAGDTRGGTGKGFTKAFVLAITNPYQIIFWLTVGVGLLSPGRLDVLAPVGDAVSGLLVVETGHPVLLVGLFGGIAIWITGFPALLVAARRRLEALAPVVAGLSAVILAGFGLAFLATALLGG